LNHFFPLILALLLSACTTLAPIAPVTQTDETAISSNHNAASLGGRFAVRIDKNGKPESTHGNFFWLSSPNQSYLEILSPFGQSQLRIELHPQHIIISRPGQAAHQAMDPDTALAEWLGFRVPLAHFIQWLNGPSDSATLTNAVRSNHDKDLTIYQDGWTITYLDHVNPHVPPKRINLYHATQKVELRLIIDNRNDF
jgi:outer membrane lipoprotein LolB